MSILMMLAASGKAPVQGSKTFTVSTSWTAPAITRLDTLVGYGARGSTTSGTTVQQYTLRTYDHVVHADGSTANNTLGTYGPYPGAAPADNCDPLGSPDGSGTRSQICYDYTDTSYTSGGGTTTGAAASAFGKTFPGSTGNVAQTATSLTNIAVTPNQAYPITVPAGGSITITWTE